MKNILKKRIFTVAAVVFALLFWFFDTSIHFFIYNEPHFEVIPSDVNELWMRIVIVLLVLLFGIFADFFIHRIMIKEKQLEVVYVYSAMLHASHHILENLVNQMQLFRLEAEKSGDFDRDVIDLYDNAIKEASDLLATLTNVKSMSELEARTTEEPDKQGLVPDDAYPVDRGNPDS